MSLSSKPIGSAQLDSVVNSTFILLIADLNLYLKKKRKKKKKKEVWCAGVIKISIKKAQLRKDNNKTTLEDNNNNNTLHSQEDSSRE